ncbi:MAG TPA: hypothetical protein VH596_17150 [Terriglobales bacterium]
MFRSNSILCTAFLLVLIAMSVVSLAQNATKRLILKDGSYQIVTKYEINGDRVHYYSAERGEWEDVPDSLVDWKATNQYEKDRAAGKMSPEAQRLEKELQEQQQEDEAKSPHVAPGLRLPPEGGVFALDTYLGEPQLLPLDQTGGEINRHTGHNVLRSVMNPVSGKKHTVEIPGPRSKLQVHASLPSIYIDIDAESDDDDNAKEATAELPWDRFHIVRVEPKGDKRIVGEIKVGVTGKSTQEQDAVPASAEQLGQGWIKLTPKQPLEAGEYAVVEMLGKQGMNSYVWDFGVHPDAPANLSVIRANPSEVKQSSQPDRLEPLKKRE